MYKYCFFIGLIGICWVSACTSSKKLLERGDYYRAVFTAVDKLQKSPGNSKAQSALRQAYPHAVNQLLNQAKHAKDANDPLRWSKTADTYHQLNQMYEAVQRSPAAMQIISNPKNYYKEYADVKGKAAAEQYNLGEKALKKNTRESAKEAYYYYLKADEYEPGYLDVDNKIDEAHYYATLKVVVEQPSVPSRYYKVSGDFFQDQVAGYLRDYSNRNQFVRFYSPEEAKKENLEPDQIMRLQFEDFVVGETNTFQKEKTVTSADSVKVGEASLKDGKKVPIYDKVTAKLITTRVEVKSRGLLSMRVLDGYTKGTVYNEDLPGEFVWFSEWATYQGDERALTKEEKRLCSLRPVAPPPPQQLFVEFTKPIYDQLTSRINRFYQNI
jgi:hypothetical protein